ncbi:MAG: hypothetical protein QMD92_07190 [bacterium]|nr:hypothetical protein [bacterium]
MKKYILKICLFILIFYILDYGLSLVIREGYKKINLGIKGKLNKLYYGNIDEKVIILGSSRAVCHFNSVVMENIYKKSTYNFGIGAAPIREHHFVLDTIIKRGYLPSHVIYNIGINTFGGEGRSASFHYIDQQPYYIDNNMLRYIIKNRGYRY